MRVRLKGLNKATCTLASGERVTYYYAWRGGPKLPGAPGSPEFMTAYNEAIASKVKPQSGVLFAVLAGYQASGEFRKLKERTRSDYIRHIKEIEREFGDLPLDALKSDRVRAEFLEWRDRRAEASTRQADYAWTVLARILSWALGRRLIAANPCEKGGRLYDATRSENVWTETDEADFLATAPKHLHLPILLALWTGQRQGDLLRLPWSAYDGRYIRLQQGKGGVRVVIPIGAPLKVALDSTTRRSTIVLVNSDGDPWTPDGFRSSWRKACAKAGIVGLTFHDLRGTAVTRLAIAGATEAEIATITGHSLRDVRSILDAHYLRRDVELGESAIRKLEAKSGTKVAK